MKKILLHIIYLFSCSLINGQFLSNIDINSGGEETKIGNIVYSYSIGGLATTTLENDEKILTQGYQQIDSIILHAINIDPLISVSAFPNPAKDKIFIVFSTLEKPVHCNLEITTSDGRSTLMNEEYIFENEIPVEIDLKKNRDSILWLKIYEKNSRKLLGAVKVILLK